MPHDTRVVSPKLAALLAAVFILSVALPAQVMQGPTTIRYNVHHDVSQPLSVMVQHAPPQDLTQREAEPLKRAPLPQGLGQLGEDPVLQTSAPLASQSPVVGLSFEGLGQGQYGIGSHTSVAPPDTNGAVGATQYVQWVNLSFIVFDKATGHVLLGPVAGNTLWSGFGGLCQTNNNGDPVVLYDKLANRWVMSQFALSNPTYLQCIAVSQTSDARGSWYRYSFQYSYLDDYPKMSVWPDAYYETFDMFSGNNYVGPDACAYDRNKMLQGLAATQQCVQLGPTVGPLLPADVDGTTPPPTGSSNYMLTYGTNTLNLYKFHVDWVTPSNSTFTGPTLIYVAAFNPLCGGGTCVPQPGTTQRLDSLADRLMYRLAYRNFGTYESLVVSHSVVAGSSGGIRWYEIQNPSGTPSVTQQGTWAPDSNYRWMPSIAMDSAGDVAVGYSVSSTSVYPSIAYAGHVPGLDSAGALETETTVVRGTGSQINGLTRWGDYSAMQVDPVDDCTFWYTQEYLKTTDYFNWNTRIANFKFANCGSVVNVSPTSFNFGNQIVNSHSSPQAFTLTNSSSSSVGITSIGMTGDYSQTNLCGSSIAGNSSCTINVTFTPTTTGTRTGTLTIVDGAGTQAASLTGAGVTQVSLTPATVSFGNVGVGSHSSAQAVTLANNQASQLTGVISITGTNAADFTQTNNCGNGTAVAVAANSSCTINVTFTPSLYAAESATLTVTDSAGTQTSSLTGTGKDVTAPTTQITTPANAWTYPGTVKVTATAADNVAVSSIQIYIDGALKASGGSSPLNYSWDTTTVANGSHSIYSKASDPTGNVGKSTTISVTTTNGTSQLIQNPGFETGTLTNWTATGAYVPFVTTGQAFEGLYSAQLGASHAPEPAGDSSLYQTITIPATAVSAWLNYYYYPACSDVIANDWLELQIQDNSGNKLSQPMKVCSNTLTWTHNSQNLIAYKGQTIRVYFNAHENGNGKLTYMYLDDVTVAIK